MKKFVLLFHDRWEQDPDIMAAWQTWFAEVGDRLVDSGNPFAGGLEVTRAGARGLAPDDGAATGYSIVSAESLDDAKGLLERCPFNSSVRIYEASAM